MTHFGNLISEDEGFQMAKSANALAAEIPRNDDGDLGEFEAPEAFAGAVRIAYDDEIEKRIPAVQGPPKIIEAKTAESLLQDTDPYQEVEIVRIDSFEEVIDPGEAALNPAETEGSETYIVAEKTEPEDLMPEDEGFLMAQGEETPAVSVIQTDERDENDLEVPEASRAVEQLATDKTWIQPSDIRKDAIPDEIETLHEQDSVTDPEPLPNLMGEMETRERSDEKEAKQVISTGVPKQYNILFEFDKWNIHPDSEGTLKEIGESITAHISPKVVISGHTDSKGSKEYNHKLSKKRAESVKKWLVEDGGLKPAIVETIAYGETKPIAPNANADGSDNPDGRRKNRRVEIMLTKGKETFISYVLH
jgi:outer membrane protein OmpA-like peptidoglycan-associated protein